MNNKEIANDIVGEICNHLCVVPSVEKWNRLVDYVEGKLKVAQQNTLTNNLHAEANIGDPRAANALDDLVKIVLISENESVVVCTKCGSADFIRTDNGFKCARCGVVNRWYNEFFNK